MSELDSRPKLTNKELSPNKDRGVISYLKLFGQNVLYSGLQEPVNGVSQLVDHIAGTNLEKNSQFMQAPKAQKFNTLGWYVATTGQSIGMLAPILLSDGMVKSVSAPSFKLPAELLNSAKFTLDTPSSIGFTVTQAAKTGALYGFMFTPANNKSFWSSKIDNSLDSGFMFTSLTASSLGLSAIGKLKPIQNSILGSIIDNNLINSAVSSVPASALSTQVSSIINTGHRASLKETLEQSYQMGIVSLEFGGLTSLGASTHSDTTRINQDQLFNRDPNPQPNLIKLIDRNNHSIETKYDANGKLTAFSIKHSPSQIFKFVQDSDNNWLFSRLNPLDETNTQPQIFDGSIKIGKDQSVIIHENNTAFKKIYRLDGTVEHLYRGGYLETLSSDLNMQRDIFKQNIKDLDQSKKTRLLNLHDSALKTMFQNNISDNDAAIYFYHLNRLIQKDNNKIFNQPTRIKLAEQILYNTNHPETISQGYNNTCNITTLEHRVYVRAPKYAAKLVTDSAINGFFVASNGKLVDLKDTGALNPDIESISLLSKKLSDKNFKDIKIDGFRNFASQIFQIAGVNILYSFKTAREQFLADSKYNTSVIYRKKLTRFLGHSTAENERLDLRYTINGKTRATIIDDNPRFSINDFTHFYNTLVPELKSSSKITMGNDRDFVVSNAPYMTEKYRGNITGFSNLSDFEDFLKNSKDKLPLILLVRPENSTELFGKRGKDHSTHVINITGTYEDHTTTPPTLKVEFTNQWSSDYNRLAEKAVTAKQLFDSSLPPKI